MEIKQKKIIEEKKVKMEDKYEEGETELKERGKKKILKQEIKKEEESKNKIKEKREMKNENT